jgi:hypothetical protein
MLSLEFLERQNHRNEEKTLSTFRKGLFNIILYLLFKIDFLLRKKELLEKKESKILSQNNTPNKEYLLRDFDSEKQNIDAELSSIEKSAL